MVSVSFTVRVVILILTAGKYMCQVPVLVDLPQHLSKDEGLPNGTVLTSFSAYHQDPTKNVLIRITSPETSDIVLVNQTTGHNITADIITKVILDRDEGGYPGKSQVTLKFVATDSVNNQIYFDIPLYLSDINDNDPKFANQPYSWNVKELPFFGNETFTKIQATDIDSLNFGTTGIRYHMEPNTQSTSSAAEYRDTFDISFDTGVVTLKKQLEYKTNNYFQFNVTAQDDKGKGMNSTPADFIIRVLDVQNEPPFFIGVPYRKPLQENIAVGFSVIKVSARDGDTGIPNPVNYTILPGLCSSLFRIDGDGHIFTQKYIDRDLGEVANSSGVCSLKIMAKEVDHYPDDQHGPTNETADVTITIEDENDNSPQFNNQTYFADVQENTPRNVPITLINQSEIMLSDADQDSNAIIELSLVNENGTTCNDFVISPSTIRKSGSALIRVSNPKLLDYETNKQIEFLIVAKDQANNNLVSTATVSLSIIDMNDNNPQFDNSSYSFSVPENSENGKFVGQITANDIDSGEFGNVSYSISGGNNRFQVDPFNGVISTFCSDCPTELDREKVDVYFMTYTATDQGGRSNSASLVVHLTDANDNTPQFSRPSYSVFIRENDTAYITTKLVQLEATDADEIGTNNSEIRYTKLEVTPSSMTSNITLNETSGDIYLRHAVDYENLENGIINLVVEARDLGIPPLASNTSVKITVQDVNDNKPIFNSSAFFAKIHENATSKASLLTFVGKVYADDADGTTPNNKVQFFITDGANNDFTINSLTGEVSVQINRKLNREVMPSYNVTIIAIDQGAPPQTGIASLYIEIIDVNDEFPVFNQTEYSAKVYENEQKGTVVIECPAADNDTNSSLKYKIVDIEARNESGQVINKTLVKDYFNIYDTNGSVYINNKLDREVAKTLVLTIQAEDENAYDPNPQKTNVTLTITLLDVNDNHPKFLGEPYHVNVSENAQDETILLTVHATDRDENRTIRYSVLKPANESMSFKIDESTGILEKSGPLDRETAPKITLHITAIDNGVPQLNSTTEVLVTVIDFNDNTPQFVDFTHTVNVSENVSVGYNILQVTASDADDGPNANVTYLLEDGDGGKFSLDAISGNLTVAASLDRETKAQYALRIRAQDNPFNVNEQKSNTTVLTIKLNDVNDKHPNFERSWYEISILENIDIETSVVQVVAVDDDELNTNNSLINYSLSNGTTPPGLFRIGVTTGNIIVNKSLIGHAGSYILGLVAEDHGHPRLKNISAVNITVLDINLNAPFITNMPDNNTISVYECLPRGRDIYHFKYNDTDNGINAKADFNISDVDGGIIDTFEIKANGTLKLVKKLNALVESIYKFQVQVTDRGQPPLSSDKKTITVQVIDVDDQLPSFKEPHKTFNVLENQPVGMVVGSVSAVDLDHNSISCYKITDTAMADIFTIGLKNGSIITRKILDYENRTSYTFPVHVTDCSLTVNISECENVKPANPGDLNDTINVTVNVIDVNDNPPVFKIDEITVGMRRVTEVNKTLDLSLKTNDYIEDKDTATNGRNAWVFSNAGEVQISSSIDILPLGGVMECPGDRKKHIVCVSGNGSLINNKYYSEDISGYFVLPVNVSDAAGSDSVNIKIFLIGDSQILIMTLLGKKEINAERKNDIMNIYSQVTGYEFVYDWLEDHKTPDGRVETFKTDLYFHVVDRKTDRVLSVSEALGIVDDNYEALLQAMQDFSVVQVVSSVKKPPEEDSAVKTVYIMAAIIAVLALTVAIIVYVSLTTRNTYKRKLRAANVKPQDIHDISEKNKTVVPGSNVYSRQANPLLHADIPEKIEYDNMSMGSHNSLDSNSIGDLKSDHYDQLEEKEVRMDIFVEESYTPEDPLDAALKQYDMQNMQNKQDTDSADHIISPQDMDTLQFENQAYIGEIESTEI